MPTFLIMAKRAPQHTVVAASQSRALEIWLSTQGYDNINHAAKEYGIMPKDFYAKPVTDFGAR